MNLNSNMCNIKRFAAFLTFSGFIIYLSLPYTSIASAQGVATNWTQPYPLSSQAGQVGNELIYADPFGYVHLFWPETGLLGHQALLYYSRFDGETWSLPVDILLIPDSAGISSTVDVEGILHLMYTSGINGDVFYTRAPIQDATSAQGWVKPTQLDISAKLLDFKVDSNGVFHCVYSGRDINQPGVYYVRSDNDGQTWSRPYWLDPDIPPDLTPNGVQLELDEENSLHIAWFYGDQELLGRWIRYANSFDQGQSWPSPFTIDKVEAGSDELRLPWPTMAVNGEEVHLIWAGDFTTHRKHRFSRDSGRTWSQATFVFGDLHGGALGHDFALDSLGQIHFFGQIRWPQGIYQVTWRQGEWSSPTMIYLITKDAFTPMGDRIHAHRVRSAIRAGNQIVVVFTSSPSDPQSILYAMHGTLPDVPVADVLPLPEKFPVSVYTPGADTEPTLASSTSLSETPTERPAIDIVVDRSPSGRNSPSAGMVWGILPVILLITSIIVLQLVFRRKS